MRKDLVEAVLSAASFALFEDIQYTHAPQGPVTVFKVISGVELAAERFEMMGHDARAATHVTRAIKAKLPSLSKGDIIDDGSGEYRVQDFQPVGDGRFEVEISLVKL